MPQNKKKPFIAVQEATMNCKPKLKKSPFPLPGSYLRAKREDGESASLDISNLHDRDRSKNNDEEEKEAFTLGNNLDQESDMDYIEEDITPGVGNGNNYEFY